MKNKANNIVWAVGAAVCLGLFYILSRPEYFNLHGMKQWPNVLLIVGMVVLLAAVVLGLRMTMVGMVAGYGLGFAAGMLFNTDSLDPGGGTLNNAWIIWTVTYAAAIFIGFVWDMVLKRKGRRR